MTKANRQELIDGSLKLGDALFRELLPAVPDELLNLDITMPQLKILVALYIKGSTRMSNLAADLQVTMATATGLVDRLVERGYLTRESLAEDRRVVLCRLSDSGQKIVSGIWESAAKRCRELLDALDTDHIQMLLEVLNTMLESAEYKSNERMIKEKIKNNIR